MHNIVRQTYILKKNVEISTLSKGITHGRGFESEGLSNVAEIVTGITHERGFESQIAGGEPAVIGMYHPRTWV